MIIKKAKALWADKRTYVNRLLLTGAVMLAACFTFIFFGPLEMVAFGVKSLVFTYKDVFWLLLLTAITVFVVGTLVISLLRGKLYNNVISICFSLTVGGYLQATFFNGSVGALTGDTVAWAKMKPEMMLSIFAWLTVIVLVFAISYFHRSLWKKMVIGFSSMLVLMQFVPLVGILAGAFEDAQIPEGTEYYLSTEGFAEYSANENVFVFVLDHMDYEYIEVCTPDVFEGFEGFTGYTDAVSMFGRTKPSVCNILTGYSENAYQVSNAEFMNKAWDAEGDNVFHVLQEKGYSIELYGVMGDLFASPETAMQYTSNIEQKEGGTIVPGMMLKKLLYLSVYRYAPMCIKPFFWEYTHFYNDGVYITGNQHERYPSNDIITCGALSEATAERQQNSFKMYHLTGSHPPFTLNRNGEDNGYPTDEYAQTVGCLTLMKNVLNQMKALGIYENATIIITADHGEAHKMWQEPFQGVQIAFFYKPSGSSETPLVWSDAQVSTCNIPATIAQAVGADPSQFGTALENIGNETVDRTFYRVYGNENGSDKELYLDRYTISGNAKDFSNWKLEETRDVTHPFY